MNVPTEIAPIQKQPLSSPPTEAPRPRVRIDDLRMPDARIYWADLFVTGIMAWGGLIAAVFTSDWTRVLTATVATFAFLRGLAFIHETTHQGHDKLPGFGLAYDLIFGWILLVPRTLYDGVHQDHHRPTTFATDQDPEYLPLAGERGAILAYLAMPFALPIVGLIRFSLVTVAARLSNSLRELVDSRASAVSINPQYRRRMTEDQRSLLYRTELWMLLAWCGQIGALALAGLLWQALIVWYIVAGAVFVLNAVRALAAHRYEIRHAPVGRDDQIDDSVDLRPTPAVRLLAPVGLYAHASHHAYPAIPYHNLEALRRRMVAAAGEDEDQTLGMWFLLREVWRKPSVQ